MFLAMEKGGNDIEKNGRGLYRNICLALCCLDIIFIFIDYLGRYSNGRQDK